MVHKLTILQWDHIQLQSYQGPSVGMSSSMRLVLPISVAVWDMMLVYIMSSSSFSLSLALSGMSPSGMDLDGWLVSDSNYRLVLAGTLNSAYNEVTFNEKLAIMKENLCTKYMPFTYKYIALNKKLPIMKQNLHIFFFIIGRVECILGSS